jgi:Domain of unknown function (DUF4340)
MKPKQLLILLIACGAIVGVALWKRADRAGDDPDSSDADNPALFADYNPDEIGSFTVKDPKNETTVTREGNTWVVASRDKYPANLRMVGEMLNNTGAFHVSSFEDFDADAIAANKLLPPDPAKEKESGTLVTMAKPGGGELLSFIAGSQITGKTTESGMPPKAQWMKVTGRDKIAKVKDGFSSLKAEPKDWLDKEGDGKFFKVEKLKSIAVAGPTPEESWKLTREKEGGEIKLEAPKEGEEFDTTKTSSQGSAFGYPSFEDVLPAAEKDKAALDKPTHTVTIETFDGPSYTVKIGAKVPPPPPPAETDKDNPPPTPPEAYYVGFEVTGQFSETPPPYATPAPAAPVAPVAPTEPAADASEEDKKKYEEAKKAHETSVKNHETAVKNHETAMKTWEEGKKSAEETFKKDLEKKKEKLAAEQGRQSRIFSVQKYVLEPVMKKRSDFMKEKPATPAASTATPPVSAENIVPKVTPGSTTAKPGGKIEAVTEPIEVVIPPKEGTPKEGTPATPPKTEVKKPDTAKPAGKKTPTPKKKPK